MPAVQKGLSRNSFWRRLGWSLNRLILYGEFRWKHASDSVIRLQKVERKKGPAPSKELIRPRSEPLKPDRLPARQRKLHRESPAQAPTVAPQTELPQLVLPQAPPPPMDGTKAHGGKMIDPKSLIPAPKAMHHRGRSSRRK